MIQKLNLKEKVVYLPSSSVSYKISEVTGLSIRSVFRRKYDGYVDTIIYKLGSGKEVMEHELVQISPYLKEKIDEIEDLKKVIKEKEEKITKMVKELIEESSREERS